MERNLQEPYVLDLGNGFTKRSMDGKTIKTEPSIIGKFAGGFQLDQGLDIVNINNQRDIYIGDDVWKAETPAIVALQDGMISRTKAREFDELLLGFIAKDFRAKSIDKVTIPLLVLGLPNNEYEKEKAELESRFTGIFGVKVNGKSKSIEIKSVKAIPQPIGTFLHVMEKKLVKGNKALVVDGGFGTLDITELNGKQIVSTDGADYGMKKSFLEVEKHIRKNYRDIKNLNTHMVSDILENGINVAGKSHYINHDDDVMEAMEDHFNEIYIYLISRYDFREFSQVIWTGGMAIAYAELISKKDQFDNFTVLEQGQKANCLGYHSYGKVVMDSVKQ